LQYPLEIPALVDKAKRLADSLGFDNRAEGNRAGDVPDGASSCVDEVGSLLRTLATSVSTGVVGEIGSGAGVGSSWLASGLSKATRLVTVEIDERLSTAVRQHLDSYPNVLVLTGDWRDSFRDEGPFDLLFLDGGGDRHSAEEVASLMRPGGMVVIDDLTPESMWPESWRGKPDPKRELAFRSRFFRTCELQLRPDLSVLLLARMSPEDS